MMTPITCAALLLLSCMALQLKALNPSYKFDGQLSSPTENIHNQNSFAHYFLPYNPVVVEVGAYEGAGTIKLAAAYPYGKIICFEPNSRAYAQLQKSTQIYRNVCPVNLAIGTFNGETSFYLPKDQNQIDTSLEPLSSLLSAIDETSNPVQDQITTAPCVRLEDWCQANQIDRIDFLRLDTEGFELQILENSPTILKTVIVLVAATSFYSFRESATLYPQLKNFLEESGFEMLGHWYLSEGRGEAIFIRKKYYDSIFR